MEDIGFFVLLGLVFGGLAVRQFVGGDRRRRAKRLQREQVLAAANALWEVRRREEGSTVFFYLWRFPDSTYSEKEWQVKLGQSDDNKFIDDHATVLAKAEAECDRRNFELTEIRRAERQEKRFRRH